MGKIFEDILSRMGGFALGRLLPAAVLLLLGFAIIKIVLRIVNVMLKKSRLEPSVFPVEVTKASTLRSPNRFASTWRTPM